MQRDLYDLLGVGRSATSAELKTAYERRLAAAASAGDYRGAAALDQAYSVLREADRRRQYDRTGLIPSQQRVPLEERYHQPVAVPFRQWTPVDAPDNRSVVPQCPDVERRRGTTRPRDYVLLFLLLVGLGGVGVALQKAGFSAGPQSGNSTEQVSYVEVSCQLPTGEGYRYVTSSGGTPACANGATPTWRDVPAPAEAGR